MKKYVVYDIKYDTDGIEIELPKTLEISIPNNITEIEEIEQILSDEISNKIGFCHFGFSMKKFKTIDLIIPKANCKYGAPHGRSNVGFKDDSKRVYDCFVPMFNDGYDKGYAYWGLHPNYKRLRVKYHKDLSYIEFYWQ